MQKKDRQEKTGRDRNRRMRRKDRDRHRRHGEITGQEETGKDRDTQEEKERMIDRGDK